MNLDLDFRPQRPHRPDPGPPPALPRGALTRLAAGAMLIAAVVSALEAATRRLGGPEGGSATSYTFMKGDSE